MRLPLVLIVGVLLWPTIAHAAGAKRTMWVYIGTYTGPMSKGIYRLTFDPATGSLGEPEFAGAADNPSFLAIHPTHRFLYAVNEIGDFEGKKSGAVTAFAVDAGTGKLTMLNHQPSGGDGPCHLTIDREGKHVLLANYGGGSAEVVPIGVDGKLATPSSFVQHHGSSVDKGRQEGPHAHSINLDPAGRFAVVADLGLDQLLIYAFDAKTGKLTPNSPPFVKTAPGAGPRHFAFHPTAPFAYVIQEMGMSVLALAYDAQHGHLKPLGTYSTLPSGAKGADFSTAEVVIHPSGKFLYGSNRGHNSVTTFAIDTATGALTYIDNQREGIKTPRNFAIDPTGKFLLVANQDGNDIVVFEIDSKSGKLKPTGITAKVPTPVCVRFVPRG